MRFLLAALVICFLVPGASARQVPSNPEVTFQSGANDLPIRFENVTLEDGLSQSTVYSIAQDHKGFMWFGTEIGLNRYDGDRIERFMPDPFDSTSIHDSYIWYIKEDADGFLWMTYEDGTVGRFDPNTGTSRNYYSSQTDTTRLAAGRSVFLMIDSKDRIWSSSQGIQMLDPETGLATRWGTHSGNGGAIGWTAGMVEEESGTFIVVGQRGVHRFNAISGTFQRLYDVPSGATLPAFDPHDPLVVWHGSLNGGVFRLDTRTDEVRQYDVTTSTNDQALEARPDPSTRGIIWVATQEGVVRLNEDSGAYTTYRSGSGTSAQDGQLLNNSIGRIYADRSGILWASAGGFGVSRFDPTAMGFGKGASNPNDPNAMRGEAVWNITPTADGVLWVVAFGSETTKPGWFLNRIDRRTGKVQYWRTNSTQQPGLLDMGNGDILFGSWPLADEPMSGGVIKYDRRTNRLTKVYSTANGVLKDDRVRRLERASDGMIWVGTPSAITKIDPTTGKHVSWVADANDPLMPDRANVWKLMEDAEGNMWVAVFGDVLLFPKGTNSFKSMLNRPDGLPNPERFLPRVLSTDLKGNVWIGLRESGAPSVIARYEPSTDRMTYYYHDKSDRSTWSGGNISGIHPHPTNPDLMFFTTYGAGVSRLDVSTGIFKSYAAADGLNDPAVYPGVWDDENTLWTPTNSGLYRYDPEDESFRRFGMEYGLQSLEFNEGVIAKSSSNELFFGGVQGFNAFFPSQLRSNSMPPDVAITEFLLFNNKVVPGPDSPLQKSIVNTSSIRLKYNQNAPSFRFAALHYKRPESNLVKYRLEPLQTEWVEANGRNEASYTNLAPGSYTFRVIAANSDGIWNETGASVEIFIGRPWWNTIWAYFMYAGILALGVFGVDRFQRRRLILKEREATRERELEQAKEIEAAYNQLRDTKKQLVEQEKLASLGSLTAGIAHEIKNPLNFVNNFAEVGAELVDELSQAISKNDMVSAQAILQEITQNSAQITKHGKRADSIVRSMMQHAKGGVSERETVDVNTFVEEYANLAWHGMRAREHGFQAEVKHELGPEVGLVSVFPQELGRVFLNLFNNAYYAVMMPGASSKPTVTISTRKEGDKVIIKVSDNGPGIPEDIREKIFEPFFTTKPTGEGTGLGLSLSHDIIVKGHNGTMRVETAPEGGAMFVIELPAPA